MSFVDFAEVKASHPIESLIPRLDLKMKQSRDQFRGPCPTCQKGGDRALVITPGKSAFFCFGSSTGGDAISLAAHIRGEPVKDAAIWIAGKGSAPSSDTTNSCTVPNENRKGSEDRRVLKPLTYLEPDHAKLKPLCIAPETLAFFDAGYAPKGIMRGRLAIPIHDLDGELVAYCGRAVEAEQKPKLIFPRDFDPKAYLFNAHRAKGEELILCRDPLTLMQAWENGIESAVSLLTDTVSAKQLTLLAEFAEQSGCKKFEIG